MQTIIKPPTHPTLGISAANHLEIRPFFETTYIYLCFHFLKFNKKSNDYGSKEEVFHGLSLAWSSLVNRIVVPTSLG